MLERGKISPLQAMGLMVGFVLGSAILIIPSAIAVSAKQDAWLSMIVATLAGLGLIAVYTSLAMKFPGQTFVQYSETILGKFIGKIAGLILIWFALHLGSLVVRDSGELFNNTFLPNTPMVVVNGITVLLVALAVRQGLEVFTRVNDMVFPLVVFILFMLTMLAIPNTDIRRFMPVLENGVKPVIAGSLSAIGFPFAETIVFSMILPYINEPQKTKRTFILGGLAGGLLLTMVILRTIGVLGQVATARLWYSAIDGVRMINLFDFIQRVESVIIINWVFFIFIKITVCFYAFVLGLAQWLNLKDYKLLVLPAGVLMMALSILLHVNYLELASFAAKTWTPYTLFIAFIIPLVIFVVDKIRGTGERGC
jgi:spore germination protein KB